MPRLRFLLLLLGGALCLGVSAQAQQQEARIEKILRPDEGKSFDLSFEKKFGTSNFDSRTGRVLDFKSLSESRQYSIKNFLTGTFRNDKAFWMGDFKYTATPEANTQARSLFTLPGKSFNTKTVAVKTVAGVEKHYDASDVPTRDFRGKERQKLDVPLTPEQAANNGYRGDLTELKSIDDVRALLNKSK